MGFYGRPVKLRLPHSVELDFFAFFSNTPSIPPEQTDSPTPTPPIVPVPMPAPTMPPSTCTIPTSESIPISPAPDGTTKLEEERRYTLPNQPEVHYVPFTAPWIAARLHDQPEERAVALLRDWAHPRRVREIDRQTTIEINRLCDGDAIDAIEELRSSRRFVRGTRGTKLSFNANIVTLDNLSKHKTNALLHSGCEGSCIDIKYVCRLGLNTTKLPRPIPVLNADGQPNSEGPISETISLELKIREHVE